jgi:hypothetical protein
MATCRMPIQTQEPRIRSYRTRIIGVVSFELPGLQIVTILRLLCMAAPRLERFEEVTPLADDAGWAETFWQEPGKFGDGAIILKNYGKQRLWPDQSLLHEGHFFAGTYISTHPDGQVFIFM